ncbi:MAG TPA: glycosyltransferase family 1 protein, partial [Candidatus Dormibacteraeota bacterium]|nr:glycosyltransferase family 1 protein [Candidatus Dormibacteraeota bacterium]
MRIGIDYRILGVGPQLITRGMGRYTQQQLREVLRVDQDDEYVLLCNRGDDLSLVDAEIRDAENVSVRYFDASLQRLERLGAEGTLRRTERFQAWVHSLDLDLYHATTPLALTEPQLIRFDACPMVATFYDVIPLLYPAAYLDEWGNRGDWMRTLRLIRGAARLLAISNAARDDAREHLGVAADRIDVAYPFPEPVFRTLSAAAAEKRAGALDRRIRVPEEFVLAVTYPHHSKNVGVLLEAYALLPASLRTELPLVICCHLDPQPRRALRAEVERLGIGDDTILTGLVSDDELCLLYNRATMVVHPSRYEGFGLPVAEAMRCGAPVITTTASSLPEIAGDAGVLVDPDDPAEFADAMARLAHDRAAREALRWKGLAQSARFTGAALAHATLRSYRAAIADAGAVSAVDAASPDGTSRLRVAMWTPVPPHPTGVAGYAVGLVDALAPACDVELFVDDDVLPDDDLLERVVIHHHTAFDRR